MGVMISKDIGNINGTLWPPNNVNNILGFGDSITNGVKHSALLQVKLLFRNSELVKELIPNSGEFFIKQELDHKPK